jgi:hypothetical protein
MLEDLHFRWTRRARVLFPGPDRLVDLPRSRIVHATFCPASRICVFCFGWDWITSRFSCQAFSDPIYLFQVKLCFPTFIRLRCTRASSFISGTTFFKYGRTFWESSGKSSGPPADTLREVQTRDQVSRPAWPKSSWSQNQSELRLHIPILHGVQNGHSGVQVAYRGGAQGASSFSSQSEI